MYGACYSFNNDLVQEYKVKGMLIKIMILIIYSIFKHIPCLKLSYDVNSWTYNYAYCNTGTSLQLSEAMGLDKNIPVSC